MLREMSFGERQDIEKSINDGFRYGDRGLRGTSSIINASVALVEQFADNGVAVSNQVRKNLDSELSKLPTNILSEYLSRPEAKKTLFRVAVELEKLAMHKEFVSHTSSTTETRSLLGCFLDYWQLDRRAFAAEDS
jgi:hypothetical protein